MSPSKNPRSVIHTFPSASVNFGDGPALIRTGGNGHSSAVGAFVGADTIGATTSGNFIAAAFVASGVQHAVSVAVDLQPANASRPAAKAKIIAARIQHFSVFMIQ